MKLNNRTQHCMLRTVTIFDQEPIQGFFCIVRISCLQVSAFSEQPLELQRLSAKGDLEVPYVIILEITPFVNCVRTHLLRSQDTTDSFSFSC